jgi:hypothetical protein
LARLPTTLEAALEQTQQQQQLGQPGPALSPAACAFLWSLLDRFVDPLLSHIRRSCQEAQPSVDASLASTLLALLEHHLLLGLAGGSLQLAPGRRASDGSDQQPQQDEAEAEEGLPEGAPVALQYLFAFCCVWGLGGGLDGGSRDSFDSCFRGLFAGVANFPEGSGGRWGATFALVCQFCPLGCSGGASGP